VLKSAEPLAIKIVEKNAGSVVLVLKIESAYARLGEAYSVGLDNLHPFWKV